MIKRASPKGKRASLFVTCMVDMLYPETGMSVVTILEHLGVEVDFPMGQTCCGQPAFNAGYRQEARQVALQFIKAFRDAELIVVPSGSCGAMVRHEYPRLFAGDPLWQQEAERMASITWEFTEFVVDGLGITDLQARLPQKQTFAFHDSCHGLRLLGLKQAGRTLVGSMENAMVVEWDNSETCCGFGGLFSVKMADVSGAM
ncbi:MAG: (Fe-S)-binding protein, partial [Anaerolineales bacterium]|nr:(Fe-S)-binding protein [Anaerolineales bacterium]